MNVRRILFFLVLTLCATAVCGKKKQELLFEAQVLCNGQPVTVTFGVSSRLKGGCFVGTNKLGRPAVNTSLKGRLVLPDSVRVPHDLRIGRRVIFPADTVLAVVNVSIRAFADCSNLTEIVLPSTLVYISDQAFLNCTSLTTVTLPPELKRIYPFAFRGCTRLRRIVATGSIAPDAVNDIFEPSTLRQATLVVPYQGGDHYARTFPWSLFNYRFKRFEP